VGNKNGALYLNLVISIAGPVLILLTVLKTNMIQTDAGGFLMLFIGFVLTISYINYLEKKAGINNKLIWMRISLSMIIFLVIGFFI
jgi:hypothetical protein